MNQHLSKPSFLFWIALVCLGTLSSCQSGGSSSGPSDSFTINGSFVNCPMDSIRLYELQGLTTEVIASAAFTRENNQTRFTLGGKCRQQDYTC